MRQHIHDDDETQPWSAAISSWTEDECLQVSVQDAPLEGMEEKKCPSASGKTQNTTKKLVLQDAAIGGICKHVRATTAGPHQEQSTS